jgi:hypothetical protein
MLDRTVKIGIEIPEDLHVAVKMEAARRRMKIKEVVKQAFEGWLAAKSSSPPAKENPETTPVPIPPEFHPLIQLLHRARANGKSISHMEKIIRVGAELKKAEAGEHAGDSERKEQDQRKMRHGGGPADSGRKP